jgi:hypothetical protein
MAKAKARPEAKDPDEGKEEATVSPGAHDAPGLSPYERMLELTRRLVNVPPKELARAKERKDKQR